MTEVVPSFPSLRADTPRPMKALRKPDKQKNPLRVPPGSGGVVGSGAGARTHLATQVLPQVRVALRVGMVERVPVQRIPPRPIPLTRTFQCLCVPESHSSCLQRL